ncbi:adenosine deaminase [Paenibacillus sp. A3]|uniref:adenosine deaminase n=1 Tax=Paenibacillus sp. A3 TaxID=1337054 RepID=UPI0009E7892B|nr:adenosine deaminase [Paenibacillus sp. A3]
MKPNVRMEWLRLLPKVDLHLHLDGSVKPETVLELAAAEGIRLPAATPEGLLPYMQVDEPCGSLQAYLGKFEFVGRFLHRPEALERVAFEVVEQAAEHGCRYIEVRFGPQLHRNRGMTPDEVISSVIAGLNQGEAQFGVKAKGIACCLRHHGQLDNTEVIEAASRFQGKGIVGVDLAGDEAAYPARLHRELFALARSKGLPVTIHAGEAAGADSVYEAVIRLGAARIGHGVRMKEDPAVLELVKERQIPLEMCPVSNIQTRAVSGWAAYPVREYFDLGIPVTINTDNLTVSGTNLTKEYHILMERFGFTPVEIGKLLLNGLEAGFMDEADKRELRRHFLQALAELNICR